MELSVAEAAARLGWTTRGLGRCFATGCSRVDAGPSSAAHRRHTGAALVGITHQAWQLVPGRIREQGEETHRLLAAD